ncbi:LamG-like jellyroll fold domain-containing protein [Haloferula sp. A504]|uniref:LamG-like jellyroll fold domain-containing protein n=1 Tax=Haloferula sp. A504 TaxID=3373601 RepID=UPI0031C0829F|nr:LamG domain-containing protein [Verrucomicrobiaceae bacterium E54]
MRSTLKNTIVAMAFPACMLSIPADAAITQWIATAQATTGNVTASDNNGAGWTFDRNAGGTGVAYDFGALDALGDKPVDGATVEFLFNFENVGNSITIGTVGGWSPGSEKNQFKLEQWNNTGKFGITLEGISDYSLTTDSIFDQTVHVVFVRRSNGEMDMYINGIFAETHAAKTNWRMDGGQGMLGARSTGTSDLATGSMFGVASYDTALSAGQIASLYNAFSSSASNSLTWGGTDDDWTVPANWVESSVPVTDGTSDVFIPSGTANFAGQLDFTGGSLLTVNGGILRQTTATSESLGFQGSSRFAVSNGGELDAQVLLSINASTGNSLSDGTITTGRLELSNGSSLTVSDNALLTADSGQSSLDGGSSITLNASTLAFRDLSLGDTGGTPSTIGIGNGALLELDAAGLGTATDVITISGQSLVNFPSGTTGTVFIDNISIVEVEAMIATGRFGLGGVRYVNPDGYSLVAIGNGVEIGEGLQVVQVVWGGSDADWSVGSNWVGGEVPRIAGEDDAIISSGTANYLGQLTFTDGSLLTINGATLTQTTAGTDYLRFHNGSTFAISNGGALNAEVRLRIWRSAGSTISNGSITAGQVEVNDNATLALGDGALVTATAGRTLLNNNAWIEVGNGATIVLRDVFLGAYAGFPSFIRVLEGGTLQFDAATAAVPTDVITIEGGSFIDLPADTTANVFIDNISQADFEALIAAGKFGIDQTRITDLSRYELVSQGSGFVIRGLSAVEAQGPQVTVIGFNAGAELEILATGLDPATTYTLYRGTDLGTFPDPIQSPVTGATEQTFIDSTPPAGKAFYRLEWTP